MNLPPIVAKWVATYEQEYGKQPPKQVIQVVTYFERLRMAIEDLGRSDAVAGRKPLSFSIFYDMTRQVIVGGGEKADECAQLYAELVRDHYMSGYNSVQEGGVSA